MWNLMSGWGQSWGVRGYQAVRKYEDSYKLKEEKENLEIANNKRKPPKPKPIDFKIKWHNALD